jgi:predicted ArsR family transcriptional regulator
VAAAVGIGRTLAAYHLDILANAGLLATDRQRPAGRSGPGAGRPAKVYTPSADEVSVSVPHREYELLARLLVEAAEHDTDGAIRNAACEAAERTGREAARAARSAPTPPAGNSEPAAAVTLALRACGYQPIVESEGRVDLRNCPFHRVAQDHPEVICGLNLRLVKGLVEESGADPSRAVLDPAPDRCCVVIHAMAG